MHFPLPRGIFVHSWVWTTKPFPLCFTVSTVALVGLAISQGPLLCPHDAAASSPYTGSTCSLSRLLLMFFLLAGGPSSLPQSNCFSSTLETQLCFVMAGFLINGWSPACSVVKSSLFQWLLYLISAASFSHQDSGALRQFVYCGSCAFMKLVFIEHLLCARHRFKALN